MHRRLGLISLVFLACGGEVATPIEEVASVDQAFTFVDAPCAVPVVIPQTGEVGDARPRHDIRGYLNGSSAVPNEYLLEEGVTLGSAQALCLPTSVPPGYFAKHTLQMEVLTSDGLSAQTFLGPGAPIGAEGTLPGGDWRQLRVTVHVQVCMNLGGGTMCQPPTVKAQRTYKIAVQPRSTFCTATFSRTEFELEDTNLATPEIANVTDVTHPGFVGLSNHTFRARGVDTSTAPVINGAAQKPFIEIYGTNPFGVHSWEPCPGPTTAYSGCALPEYNALEEQDTFRPHALRFPRVEGANTINKLPYSYTCTQPTIVRDRIADCSGSMPDTYYRLPFLKNWRVEVSQGNCSDSTHKCGGGQEFALDMAADVGTPVLAARGGRVVKVYDVETEHCWGDECDAKGIEECGNVVRVQHQDNTFAIYGHLTQGSMFVSVGQTIKRGQILALSGHTGQASGPHLHFHVRKALTPFGKASIPVSYQYFINEPLNAVNLKSCRIPAEDGDHWSSNVWVFP